MDIQNLLYTVSDKLLKHQATLESFLADREQTLFNLKRKIILYDLTNTYFEGQCAQNPKAKFGRSKEKCTDCPLITLGLVLDADGFPLSSQVFLGNASEPATLKLMLNELRDRDPFHQIKPVIIMDARIASADNVVWLIEQDYQYLVVSREQHVKIQEIRKNRLRSGIPRTAMSLFIVKLIRKPGKLLNECAIVIIKYFYKTYRFQLKT